MVRRFAVAHELHRASVLRVHKDSPYLLRDFNRFLERLNHHSGTVKWLAVPEYDKDIFQHVHLLTSLELEEQLLRDCWISPYGSIDPNFYGSEILATIDDIRTYANYLSKGFGLPENQRPTKRRYRNSRHPHPKPMVFHGVTKSDLDLLSHQIEVVAGTRINTWTNQQFWCPEIRTWTSAPGSSDDVKALLNSYKPV